MERKAGDVLSNAKRQTSGRIFCMMKHCITNCPKNVQVLGLPSIAVVFFLNGTCLLELRTNSRQEIHRKHLDSLTTWVWLAPSCNRGYTAHSHWLSLVPKASVTFLLALFSFWLVHSPEEIMENGLGGLIQKEMGWLNLTSTSAIQALDLEKRLKKIQKWNHSAGKLFLWGSS